MSVLRLILALPFALAALHQATIHHAGPGSPQRAAPTSRPGPGCPRCGHRPLRGPDAACLDPDPISPAQLVYGWPLKPFGIATPSAPTSTTRAYRWTPHSAASTSASTSRPRATRPSSRSRRGSSTSTAPGPSTFAPAPARRVLAHRPHRQGRSVGQPPHAGRTNEDELQPRPPLRVPVGPLRQPPARRGLGLSRTVRRRRPRD